MNLQLESYHQLLQELLINKRMKVVIVNIAREEGGVCYNLVRVIEKELWLDRMRVEYPFPLEVYDLGDSITAEDFENWFPMLKVEGEREWYYNRGSLKTWLKEEGGIG